MKNLLFHRLSLISLLEKSAKSFTFDPKTTLILGSNSVGKSCLLRSLYWTLGAEPKLHPKWKAADVHSVLEFSLEKERFAMYRHGRNYSLYDARKKLIRSFSSVTNELAPFFADFFDFHIKLNDKSNSLVNLPPAFLFLPYYIDQDVSWQKNWASFQYLSQFSSEWRKAIVEFHTGIRPKEYYLAKAALDAINAENKRLNTELELLKEILEKMSKTFKRAQFNFDSTMFKNEVRELLSECKSLKIKQDDYKKTYSEAYAHQVALDRQIAVVSDALGAIEKDSRYVDAVPDSVDCPTCGATYENTFEARFEIAKDANRCQELLVELNSARRDMLSKIADIDSKFTANTDKLSKIEQLLSVKEGQLALKDVIEAEGGKQAKSAIYAHRDFLLRELGKIASEVTTCKGKIKKLDDKEHRLKIIDAYLGKMREYLPALDVKIDEEYYKSIDSKVEESGSKLPRALIAYYFSAFHVMHDYSTSTFCPIVLDSPNQQAQDDINLPKLLSFIRDHQPKGSQMILGLENTENISFKATVLELTTKEKLLSAEDYDKTFSEIKSFLLE